MSEDTRIGVIEALRATPRPVRYLLGGVLINQLGAFVQTFLLLYLMFRGESVGAAGLVLVAYSVGSILGATAGAELTGRFGPRTTIVLAMASSAPLVASIPLVVDSYPLLLAVTASAGLVTQAYRPAAAVLLSDLMPAKFHTMSFSMMRIALNLGAALAPLIAAGLILLDWDLLFWLDGATAAVYALLAVTLLPRRPAGVAEDHDPAETPVLALDTRQAYGVLFRDRRFLCFLFAVLLGTIMYVQSYVALPLELLSDGYPTGLYSAVLALSSVTLITCELKITTYVVRLPVPVAGLRGHLVNSVGFVVYALAGGSPVLVLVGAVLCVTGIMMAGPSMFAHPATFPAQVKARYIGAMQVTAALGMAVGPLIGVFAWTALHSGFWVLAAVVNTVAGVLAMIGLGAGRRARADTDPTPVRVARETVRDTESEDVGGAA